jgi:GTP cyclohydrolase I
VEIFSRRLQIQEQLTVEIRDALQKHLKPKGVAVVIEAHHMCMAIRGVQKPKTSVVTSSLSGSFLKEDKTRKEFMNLIGLSK